ncbi:LGFP repeat-containing protein [Nocardia camponoti]|uniref:Esterase n=1 Tax=Nocardia camponoti TaxID=1616106 RepID=A0A917QFG2_9NOCA|nr:esterase [Nocardia camponoti]GGK48005.1 hypothetical protein GCM10011591_19230 [Nocardia camponoti]
MTHFARSRALATGVAVIAAAGLLLTACSDDDSSSDNVTASATSALSVTATPDTSAPSTSATAAGDSTTILTPTGEIAVSGEIYKKYTAFGGTTSPLGNPTGPQENGPNGGLYQDFDGGAIYWSSATGAHVVWGDIREAWDADGGVNGTLGYPTSDEKDITGGKQSDFEGGTITWVNGQTTVTPK